LSHQPPLSGQSNDTCFNPGQELWFERPFNVLRSLGRAARGAPQQPQQDEAA
jgi:hypothetical protein